MGIFDESHCKTVIGKAILTLETLEGVAVGVQEAVSRSIQRPSINFLQPSDVLNTTISGGKVLFTEDLGLSSIAIFSIGDEGVIGGGDSEVVFFVFSGIVRRLLLSSRPLA